MSALGKAVKKLKGDGLAQTFKWALNSLKIRSEQRKSVKRFDFDARIADDGSSVAIRDFDANRRAFLKFVYGSEGEGK